MTLMLSRRFLIATGLAAVALPGAAFAMTADQARSLVDKLVADINTVISSGKSEAGMISDFEKILDRYSDVGAIARYALGPDARSANPDQMRRFTAAFRGYAARKYGRRFREFIGGKIEVRGTSPLPRGTAVQTMAILRGQSPFAVDFYVSDASGKVLFYNIIIEGIDMLLSERTEIGAMLDRRRGDINALISDLQSAS